MVIIQRVFPPKLGALKIDSNVLRVNHRAFVIDGAMDELD